jgi:hypothetical protein
MSVCCRNTFSAGQRDAGTGTVSRVGSYDDDLRFAHVLADAADDITTKRFKALDLRVETKPDLTPVSDADRAAEDSIRNILRRSRPRDAVLGEESGQTGSGSRRWIIDPIDATKNYVRGVPVWATLIGLMDGDAVVAGVVTAPALGRRWWAAKGGGAWTGKSLTSASRCRVSKVGQLADASFSYSGVGGWAETGPSGAAGDRRGGRRPVHQSGRDRDPRRGQRRVQQRASARRGSGPPRRALRSPNGLPGGEFPLPPLGPRPAGFPGRPGAAAPGPAHTPP